MEEYKGYVSARLSQLSPFMQSYALGDFSETIEIPEEEDEFSELLVGLVLMVDDIKELVSEKEDKITKLEQTEQALRESEGWLSTTLRSIGDAVIATDAQGLVTLMNPVAEELTGWDEAETVGQPLEDVLTIINEQTGERVESPVAKVLRAGVTVGLVNHTVLIAKDGTRRPIADSGAPMRDEGGKIIGTVLVFRDITERRQAEEALRISVARGRAVLDAMPDLMFQISKEGIFLDYKAAGGEGLALPPSVFLDKNVHDVMPPEFAQQAMSHVEQALHTGDVQSFEYQLPVPFPDGDLSNFEARLVASGEDEVLIIVRDITERRQAEEELAQRVEDLESFNRLAVGREMRMIELKRQINDLSEQLGKEVPYDVSFLEE